MSTETAAAPAAPDKTRARASQKARKPHRATKAKPETWTHRFIAALADNFGDPTAAAKAVGKHRSTAFGRRASDPDFDAAWTAVTDGFTDRLERGMMERAILGDKEPVISKGEIVGERVRFDTTLQWNLLRCRRSALYNKAPGDGEAGAGSSARESAAKLRESLAAMGGTVPAAALPDEGASA